MSGGRFVLTFHEPGELVPALETFGAVSAGTIDAGWTTPGHHTGTLGEGITFFTSVPFGPNFGEFLAWKQYGGGQELREEIYNAHGVTALDSFCIGPETSGWFKVEITNPARQLPGLKMRFFGLGAEVMQKMGVSTVLLAGRDILRALRSGELDATEFSMPMVDIDVGFHEVAKYNYFPGWHQQVGCSELLMNLQRYNALPEAYKSMLKAAATEQVAVTFAETEAENPLAMRRMEEQYGVEFRRWRDETLRQFEEAWQEVVAEKSASDAGFKKIADSYFAFRETYRIWGEAQAMKVTYLDDEEPAAPSTILFPLFMAKDDTRGLQGFARITNLSDEPGTVTIHATDDAGTSAGEEGVELSLDALQTQHFNSGDLEDGNRDKGLNAGTGDGSGNWRLEITSELDIEARAFVRTTDGFVTSMQRLAVETEEGSMRYRVPFFNPGKNEKQQSSLRLINPGASDANVAIDGVDNRGDPPAGGTVRLTLAPGAASTLTARQLEEGGSGFTGNFEAGSGKWQLFVSSDRPLHVMGLLYSRETGNLTNVSQ
jgi:TRAP-type mannitol/chloroaromatic compound transport system substrate-binding protein